MRRSDLPPWRSLIGLALLLSAAACGATTHEGRTDDATRSAADAATTPPDDPAGTRDGARDSPGSGAAGSGSGQDAGRAPVPPTVPPPSDAGAPPPVAGPCGPGQQPGDADRRALDRLGLFGSTAVIEGVLLAATDVGGRRAARVSIERVVYGWGFLEGSEVLVPMSDATYADLGAGARVILGMGAAGQRPSASTLMTDVPFWEPLAAAIRAEQACEVEPLLGYQPWQATAVGVARIVAQDAARTTFEVVETLAGELPSQFLENWPVEWALPYPGVSDAEYIVSIVWFDDTFGLGSIADIRPADAARRDEVERALARWADPGSPERAYLARLESAAEAAMTTRSAWLYNRAELVASLEVSGKSPRCCAALDGVYLAGDVVQVWKGTAPEGPLITRLEDLFSDHACGGRFIHALSPRSTLGQDWRMAFTCGEQPTSYTYDGQTVSQHAHRMPDTPEHAEAVAGWVASGPPLYRLYPLQQAATPELFAAAAAPALWSVPLEPEAALAAGPLILITIESVAEHAGGHEVVLTTQFSYLPLEHLPVHELKLFFAGGDARLLQAGQSWLVPVASLKGDMLWREETASAAIAAGEAFLVPGLLLPVRDELQYAATVMRTYPDPGVSLVNPP